MVTAMMMVMVMMMVMMIAPMKFSKLNETMIVSIDHRNIFTIIITTITTIPIFIDTVRQWYSSSNQTRW